MISESELLKYRKEIDTIDKKLLALLDKRSEIVKQVGKLKQSSDKNNGKSIIRPGREAEMVRQIADGDNAFPKTARAIIWRLIIAASVGLEEESKVAVCTYPSNRSCYWMAREYFGAFTPSVECASPREVIQTLLDGDVTVGVVPLREEEGITEPWWVWLGTLPSRPKIFARLPFIRVAPSKRTPVLVLGNVDPEETSDDRTLYNINVPRKVSFDQFENILKDSEIPFEIVETVLGAEGQRHFLVKFEEFLTSSDDKIVNLIKEFEEADEESEVVFLGTYAKPMLYGDVEQEQEGY